MDKTEVKKELYKSKVQAIFSHYCSGSIYYTVEISGDIFQFPIETVEYYEVADGQGELGLSSDLGTTSFYKEMKGSELNRWIGKAIDNNEFNKI